MMMRKSIREFDKMSLNPESIIVFEALQCQESIIQNVRKAGYISIRFVPLIIGSSL